MGFEHWLTSFKSEKKHNCFMERAFDGKTIRVVTAKRRVPVAVPIPKELQDMGRALNQAQFSGELFQIDPNAH